MRDYNGRGHKSILITGGTGTFGRAFARRMLELPATQRVCIYSRDEHKQAVLRAELNDDPRLRWFIGDIRDLERLTQAMEGCELVVHAAALKRVEVGEYNPAEMVKTNVLGAINVICAASAAPMQPYHRQVIALSTDKACSPTNAYGATKLTMEKMMLAANNTVRPGGPRFAVTRYGNVAGSAGSVIPTWRRALANGKPLVITDPEATRFWMTIDQAVDLVEWTAANMLGGEIVVPDLPAYDLRTLLKVMTDADPERDTTMKVIGLQPGEKLHETMITEHEAPAFWRIGDYWVSGANPQPGAGCSPPQGGPLTSDMVQRMSEEWLTQQVENTR